MDDAQDQLQDSRDRLKAAKRHMAIALGHVGWGDDYDTTHTPCMASHRNGIERIDFAHEGQSVRLTLSARNLETACRLASHLMRIMPMFPPVKLVPHDLAEGFQETRESPESPILTDFGHLFPLSPEWYSQETATFCGEPVTKAQHAVLMSMLARIGDLESELYKLQDRSGQPPTKPFDNGADVD